MECILAFNRSAEDYDKWYSEGSGSIIFESEIKAVKAMLPPGLGVEVGLGTGVFSERLKVSLGIDPALNMLKLAKNRGLEVILAAAEFIPVRAGLLDYALLLFTICFLDYPVESFKEIRRILKVGGSLVLSFIPRESEWGRLCEEKKRTGHPIYCHARFYSLQQVRIMLQESRLAFLTGNATLRQSPDEVREAEEPTDKLEPETRYGLICLRAVKPSD